MIKLLAALAVVTMLAACTSSGSFDTGGHSSSGPPGPYEQTWKVSYADTTCDQFLNSMTDHERFVAAHDWIIALSAYDQSDDFARTFEAGVTTDCKPAPNLKVKEIAAALATIDSKDFPR